MPRIRKSHVLIPFTTLAALVAAQFSSACSTPEGPPVGDASHDAPNIVLIISDDQAWTDYGFMAHEHIRTPHLDRLAAQGMLFRRGYVASSLCRPSLATMVTGLYPHQHRLTSNDQPKGQPREALTHHIDDAPTLPRLLAEKGYVSFQSGKWWEGSFERGGFTHGMTRGERHGDEGLTIGRKGLEPVFSFIDTAVAEGHPFFVWYAPFLPHRPHNPPARLLEHYTELAPTLHVARYRAMCEWFDETCGELLGFLDERQLAENTLVLFVCDNGWIQQTDGGGFAPRSKRSPYDGGVRTPIIVRWPESPGGAPTGDSPTLVSSIDLAPTILAACGLQPTADMAGANLLDTEALGQRDAVFGGIYAHDAIDPDDPVSSLLYRWCVVGRWKLILPHEADAQAQLYDVAADPFEERDLAKELPERVDEMIEHIESWWEADAAD